MGDPSNHRSVGYAFINFEDVSVNADNHTRSWLTIASRIILSRFVTSSEVCRKVPDPCCFSSSRLELADFGE